MNSETSPSAQTPVGISRQRKRERDWSDMVAIQVTEGGILLTAVQCNSAVITRESGA